MWFDYKFLLKFPTTKNYINTNKMNTNKILYIFCKKNLKYAYYEELINKF